MKVESRIFLTNHGSSPGELPAGPPGHGPGTRRLIHQLPGQRRPGRTPQVNVIHLQATMYTL
jgi:hypothetical protein